jgi:DHA1 family multidrug resistance protein-like MFS transporter
VSGHDAQQFPYWRRNLKVLPASNFLVSLGFAISWPFLPLMVRELGVHERLETWVGYMALGFYVVSFVMNPIWGGIADHYGRKMMVLRASVGMGFPMMLVPFAQTPLAFALLLMLIAVCNGSTAAGMALLVANTPPRRIGRALAIAQTGSLIGQTMGPAAGAMLAGSITRPHWLFWASGALLLVAGTLVAFFVQEVKRLAPGRWRLQWLGNLREIAVAPRVKPLFFLSFLFAMLWGGSVPIMSLYVLDLLQGHPGAGGNEAMWIGAVALGLGISAVVAMPVWGRFLDRRDPARVLAFAVTGAAVTQLPLLVLQTPLQLVLARIAFGLGAAAMQPAIMRLLKDYAPRGMDARAISYAASFQFVAMGLAPFSAGLMGPTLGLRAYFAFTITLTLVGLALWLRSGRVPKSESLS